MRSAGLVSAGAVDLAIGGRAERADATPMANVSGLDAGRRVERRAGGAAANTATRTMSTRHGYGADVDSDATDSGSDFPLRDMLGFSIEQGDGVGTTWLDVDERHINPHGAVHGAVMFALVDTAMGGATMSVLDEGNWCATVDINTRFLAPCFGGRITGTATVRRAGRRIVHLDGVVVDESGVELMAASGVFAVIPAPG